MDRNQFGDKLGIVTHSETLCENNNHNFILFSSVHLSMLFQFLHHNYLFSYINITI